MAVDQDKLMEFLNRFVADLGATVAAGGVVIGHRLGLYRALAKGPATAEELARRTNTDARYVAEWLRGQAAGGYVTHDARTYAMRATGGTSRWRRSVSPSAAGSTSTRGSAGGGVVERAHHEHGLVVLAPAVEREQEVAADGRRRRLADAEQLGEAGQPRRRDRGGRRARRVRSFWAAVHAAHLGVGAVLQPPVGVGHLDAVDDVDGVVDAARRHPAHSDGCVAVQARRSSAAIVLTTSSGSMPWAAALSQPNGCHSSWPGGVGVGVDGDLAAPLEGQVEQLVGRVLALGPAVDLDRGAELGAGGEHDLGVELEPAAGEVALADLAHLPGTLRPVQWPRMSTCGLATAMHHAPRHLRRGHRQLRVDAGHDDVELGRAGRRRGRGAPSSRMSTSMPVRMRNGASCSLSSAISTSWSRSRSGEGRGRW